MQCPLVLCRWVCLRKVENERVELSHAIYCCWPPDCNRVMVLIDQYCGFGIFDGYWRVLACVGIL